MRTERFKRVHDHAALSVVDWRRYDVAAVAADGAGFRAGIGNEGAGGITAPGSPGIVDSELAENQALGIGDARFGTRGACGEAALTTDNPLRHLPWAVRPGFGR
jgi:hypothetical protein